MANSTATLLFVYNAKSGLLHGALDFVHKIVSPSTYACSLCGLTYGNLGMKKDWAVFVASLPLPVAFAYPDTWAEFVDEPLAEPVPAAFLVTDRRARLVIPPVEINEAGSLGALREVVADRLKESGILAATSSRPAPL